MASIVGASTQLFQLRCVRNSSRNEIGSRQVKHWERIADNLSEAGLVESVQSRLIRVVRCSSPQMPLPAPRVYARAREREKLAGSVIQAGEGRRNLLIS